MGTGIPNIGSSAIGDPIGKAVVEIIADDKAYTEGLKKSSKALTLFDKKTQKIAKRAGKAFLAGGAAITAALAGVVFHAAKAGDELDKMSLRTGVSVENLSRLSFAAQRSGSDVTGLETSLRFLSRGMDEASKGIGRAKDVFEDLGISIQDQDSTLRSQPEVILDVAEAISNLESETKQVAAAMDIFGARSGPGLLPLLKQGASGIEELTARADELGIVMSTEAASASAEFQDRMLELSTSFKMAAFNLGQTLLPEVEKAVQGFTKLIAKFNALPEATQKLIGFSTAAAAGVSLLAGSALILAAQLPAAIAGAKLFAIALASIPAVGPIAIGLAGVTAGILALVGAYKLFDKAVSDTREELIGLEAVTRSQRHNMDQIQVGIDLWKDRLDGLNKAQSQGLQWMQRFNKETRAWEDITIAEGIAFIEEKISGLSGELRRAGGDIFDVSGKLNQTQKEAKETGESFEELLEKVNAGTKEYATFYDALIASFTNWTDITGKGYKESTAAQVAYLNGLLESVEEESEAWRGLNNLRSDLRDEDIRNAVQMASKRLRILKAVLEEQARLETQAAMSIQSQLLTIQDDGLAEQRKTTADNLKELATIPDIEPKEISFGFGEAQAEIKKEVDETNRLMGGVTQAQINNADDRAKRDEKGRQEREKELKKELAIQQAAIEKSKALWQDFTGDVRGSFTTLFDDMLDPSVLNKWDNFWSNLAASARRHISDLLTSRLFDDFVDVSQGQFQFGQGTSSRAAFRGVPAPVSFSGAGRTDVKGIDTGQRQGPTKSGEPLQGGADPFTAILSGLEFAGHAKDVIFRDLTGPNSGVPELDAAIRKGLMDLRFAFPDEAAFVSQFKSGERSTELIDAILNDYQNWITGPGGHRPYNPPDKFGIFGLAEGGIVTKPTFAMIGESGPEAVVPLRNSNLGLGGDSFTRIDQLVIQMPPNINEMSQAELDKNTTKQMRSIARGFRRDPQLRRSITR